MLSVEEIVALEQQTDFATISTNELCDMIRGKGGLNEKNATALERGLFSHLEMQQEIILRLEVMLAKRQIRAHFDSFYISCQLGMAH